MASIDEVYFPFDAVEVEGEYDRVYSAKDFANYFKQFLTNGVYPNPSTNLQVQSLYGNMVVTVLPGSCFINGYCYILNENLNVTISESNAAYNRIDAVVAQLNHTERCIRILYKEGAPSASPAVPTLIRNDDVYEIRLAQILVKSGAVKILDSEITDTRLSTTVCGVVTSLVDQVATETLYKQYVSYLNQQMAAWNATKAQQATDFNNQMTAQQTTFNQIKATWEKWVAEQQVESTHNHDARYYTKTESDNKYMPVTSSANKNWHYSVVDFGYAVVWGGGSDCYVKKISDFSVANSEKLGGLTLAQLREEIKKAGDVMGKIVKKEALSARWGTESKQGLIKQFNYTKGGMARIYVSDISSYENHVNQILVTTDSYSVTLDINYDDVTQKGVWYDFPFNSTIRFDGIGPYTSQWANIRFNVYYYLNA